MLALFQARDMGIGKKLSTMYRYECFSDISINAIISYHAGAYGMKLMEKGDVYTKTQMLH